MKRQKTCAKNQHNNGRSNRNSRFGKKIPGIWLSTRNIKSQTCWVSLQHVRGVVACSRQQGSPRLSNILLSGYISPTSVLPVRYGTAIYPWNPPRWELRVVPPPYFSPTWCWKTISKMIFNDMRIGSQSGVHFMTPHYTKDDDKMQNECGFRRPRKSITIIHNLIIITMMMIMTRIY